MLQYCWNTFEEEERTNSSFSEATDEDQIAVHKDFDQNNNNEMNVSIDTILEP